MRNSLLPAFLGYVVLLSSCTTALRHKQGWITAGHLRVFFTDQGEGDPLVFLHAGFQDHRMWDRQVERFSKDHRVIAFDQPGQGQTTGSDTTILIADVIKTVMDSLGIRQASFIGLSMGSVAAVDLVLTYPERVNKIVFVSPGLSGWQGRVEADSLSMRLFRGMDSAFASPDKEVTAKRFTRLWCIGPFRDEGSVNRDVREYVYRTTLTCMQQHAMRDLSQFDPKGEAGRINQIHKKVLIIHGDEDVPLIGSMARYMHSQIAGSQVVTIPGAAHMVNMEKPGEFNHALAAFLE